MTYQISVNENSSFYNFVRKFGLARMFNRYIKHQAPMCYNFTFLVTDSGILILKYLKQINYGYA